MTFDIEAVKSSAKVPTKRKSSRFGNAVYQALEVAPEMTMTFNEVYYTIIQYDIDNGTFDKNAKYFEVHDNNGKVSTANIEALINDLNNVTDNTTFITYASRWQYLHIQTLNKIKVLTSTSNTDNKSNIHLNVTDYPLNCEYSAGNFQLVER